ncbi:MAG TPA: hypothetical protein VNA20_05285 [Frankiaceae bacterium]|nr:hypothetical protein [Frankiaceae bacterium]
MKRALARLATVAATIPLLVGAAAGASHAGDTTVPGCYGAGFVVCDLTITIGAPIGVETYNTTFPICAGTCVDVPLTMVGTTSGEPTEACYQYSDRNGNVVARECFAGGGGGGGLVDTVREIVEGIDLGPVLEDVEVAVNKVIYRIQELIGDADVCAAIYRTFDQLGYDVQCA